MTKTVLITTSGIGERLGNLTKFTNKSLVNVGDKYGICYIIESYDSNTEFIITLGYYGNLVKDFLLLAYKNRNFIFVDVDNYSGKGSSLGYSLLQAKNYLQKPFIFHCCDAIVTNHMNFDDNKNILCVIKCNSSEHYTNIKVNNDVVTEINNKKHHDFDFVYTGISLINDYKQFWKNLENIYNSDKLNSTLNDVDSFKKMIQLDNCVFYYKVLDDWYDTGNVESYEMLKNILKPKYSVISKNNESLCFFDTTVVKFVNDVKINEKRIKRGIYLYPLTPKLIRYSNNFIEMEKIEGIVLSEYYKHGEVYNLLTWAKNNLWVNQNIDNEYKNNCYNFYINKTNSRINDLSFLKNKQEITIINGINTDKISNLLNKIPLDILITDTFYHFHGDFILDNIMKTKDSYVLIDWRHEFDNQLTHGDIYYDLSKLRHNIIFNHKNILNKLYEINYNNENITLDLKCNYFLIQQLYDFDKFIIDNGFDLKKIKIITSLIWINMSSLYDGLLSEFLFYFGKYNLFLSLQYNNTI
jgi:NDP-sugar pyrophosphorylase family protein